MVQRLGLAQALLHEPELLVLDEPTTGLDPEGRRLVAELVSEQKRRGTAVLLSSHILSDVERVCDVVVILRRGKVVLSDRVATVTAELRHLGVTVEERPDSLLIQPGWSESPAVIETHNDHRIAMAFAIAGLARGNVTIEKEQVVSKSYPRFWRTLDEVVE
jgi:ABC-2 type transport system ATP-binding protein